MKEWLSRLFETIDRMDIDGFVSFLGEEASFRFANAPVVYGRDNIRSVVSNLFSNIKGIRHAIEGIWEQDGIVICEGEVTYMRHDGQERVLPFMNIFRMSGPLIADYRIYMDISPLFAA